MKVELENDWISKDKLKVRVINSFEGTMDEFKELMDMKFLKEVSK
jgi:hypothetical protein